MVSDKRICAWYALIFLIMVIAVRQKDYEGATLVRDMSAGLFERLIENDDSNTQWLVEFYTSWADDCVHFTSLFAILSLKYTSPGLKLARVNVGLAHNERIADKYKINITTRSTQLPTLVLFQHGRPIPEHQLPPVDKKSGKVTKCIMNQRIVTEFFELKERTKLEYKSKTSKTAHQMKAKKQK